MHTDRQIVFSEEFPFGEVNVADVVVYDCVSPRTAASVHVAKWSPDGEYFATVGKVKDSCEHTTTQQTVEKLCSSVVMFTYNVCPIHVFAYTG